MIEKRLVAQEMTRLGAVFNRAVDKATMSVYYEAMSHLTPEELTWAVKEAVAVERFFPPPAALLEHAKSMPRRAVGIVRPQLSPGVLAALPEDAREAYEAQRQATGTTLLPMSPAEAHEAVERIRQRSDLQPATRLPYKDPE